MFKSGQDNMRMEPTPERVYALGKFIIGGAYSREDLYQEICLGNVFGEGSRDNFGATLNVAQELGIIKDSEGQYTLNVLPHILDGYDTFRKFASHTALSRENTLFFRTTSLFLMLAEQVLKCQSWSAVANLFNQNGVNVTDNDILGWRFWVSFFGLGYLHQTMLIPNTYNRFKDVLNGQDEFNIHESIPIVRFFNWLEIQCPEIKESRLETRIGLGVSNGLRTLHSQGNIELISQPDSLKWQLFGLESEDINDISHVRIVR